MWQCNGKFNRRYKSRIQHFGKQAPLFFQFVFLLEMMGSISKHENSHAVLMFTRGGDEGGCGHSVHGCKQKLETLYSAQIPLLPEWLNLTCATMESNALIYLPGYLYIVGDQNHAVLDSKTHPTPKWHYLVHKIAWDLPFSCILRPAFGHRRQTVFTSRAKSLGQKQQKSGKPLQHCSSNFVKWDT